MAGTAKKGVSGIGVGLAVATALSAGVLGYAVVEHQNGTATTAAVSGVTTNTGTSTGTNTGTSAATGNTWTSVSNNAPVARSAGS